jgi:lysophospholipase L1-like esterase
MYRGRKLSQIISSLIVVTAISFNISGLNVKAAADYKFDFGGGALESGYIGVSASTAYSKTLGYGFNTPQNMKNVTASGSGVASDAVQFLTYGTKSTNTFNVDVPNGLYEVTVILGNTSRASVATEGVFQIMNMTGNNAVDKFQIPITDGQLNLLVTEGKAGTAFTLSALEIKKLSDNPVTNRTIYIGGDSTVCNYYPLDTSVQAGWGQMLSKYVGTGYFQIRNMATSGQIAGGFRDDGQFEAIMKYLKPGDYFILQFGINDTNEKNNTTEAQFKEIMRDMVVKAKATGATVVLSTPQGRATDFNSSNVHTTVGRWYRLSTIALAKEENVQLLDLNVLSSAYFTSIGPDATLALYMTGDTLHPNRQGATQLARIAYENLKLPFNSPTPIKNTNTPTFTPTKAPVNTPTQTSTAKLLPEDINGDGAVNMADVIMIARNFNA